MKEKTKRRRLAWLGWLLVGVGAAALLCLFALPWPMAGAAGLPDDAVIESVTVLSSTVSETPIPPVLKTAEDSETCRNFAECFRENSVRWSGFASGTLVYDHGTAYDLIISCSNGRMVECTYFDGKLYCGRFRYTLSAAGETRLREHVTALAEN